MYIYIYTSHIYASYIAGSHADTFSLKLLGFGTQGFGLRGVSANFARDLGALQLLEANSPRANDLALGMSYTCFIAELACTRQRLGSSLGASAITAESLLPEFTTRDDPVSICGLSRFGCARKQHQ